MDQLALHVCTSLVCHPCLPNLSALADMLFTTCTWPSSPRRTFAIHNNRVAMPRRRNIGVASIQSRVQVFSAKSCPARPIPRGQYGRFGPSSSAQDSPSGLGAMNTLFPPAPCAEEGEHAVKRRKTDHDSIVMILQPDFDEQSSIVLAKISLGLVSAKAVSYKYVYRELNVT